MILMQMQQVAEDGTWPFQLLQPRGCHFLSRLSRLRTCWHRPVHLPVFIPCRKPRSHPEIREFGSLSLSSASRAVSCSVWYFVILPDVDVQSFGVKRLSIPVYYIYLSIYLFIYLFIIHLFIVYLFIYFSWFIHIHSTLLLLYRYIYIY